MRTYLHTQDEVAAKLLARLRDRTLMWLAHCHLAQQDAAACLSCLDTQGGGADGGWGGEPPLVALRIKALLLAGRRQVGVRVYMPASAAVTGCTCDLTTQIWPDLIQSSMVCLDCRICWRWLHA